LKNPHQAFLLSWPDLFKKKQDPLKVSFFLHRICSILEKPTQAFLLSSPDWFTKPLMNLRLLRQRSTAQQCTSPWDCREICERALTGFRV
jgi:hypothetical protein